jgi:hypothetical protein
MQIYGAPGKNLWHPKEYRHHSLRTAFVQNYILLFCELQSLTKKRVSHIATEQLLGCMFRLRLK